MIITDFAPNITKRDAILALKLLFQPLRWRRGKSKQYIKRRLKFRFFGSDSQISTFLTGRAALYQYLKNLNLNVGDEILVQGFTCEAVVLPILKLNLKPIYVDINSDDYSMNINDLKKKYSNRSKVIVLQHTFGISPKYQTEITLFAKKHKIEIIHDVAHGFDPEKFHMKKYEGTILMSFGRSKAFSSVFGGAIISQNKKTTTKMRDMERQLTLPSYWFIFKILIYQPQAYLIKLTYNIWIGKIIHAFLNYFGLILKEITTREKKGEFDITFLHSFPNVCALLLLQQLDTFNDVVDRRTAAVDYYNNNIVNNSIKYSGPLSRYPLVVGDQKKTLNRSSSKGVLLGSWYTQPVAPKELDLEQVGYIRGSCPVAEKINNKIINLPTNITLDEVKKVTAVINDELNHQ